MATAQEQLMGMLNPQTARLLDNQMRQKQVAQRSQGAGMLSGLTQAYTGMADALTGAAGLTPMGVNEQQAIQDNKATISAKIEADKRWQAQFDMKKTKFDQETILFEQQSEQNKRLLEEAKSKHASNKQYGYAVEDLVSNIKGLTDTEELIATSLSNTEALKYLGGIQERNAKRVKESRVSNQINTRFFGKGFENATSTGKQNRYLGGIEAANKAGMPELASILKEEMNAVVTQKLTVEGREQAVKDKWETNKEATADKKRINFSNQGLALLRQGGGLAQLAAQVKFFKNIDPDSVVKDSEIAMITQANGLAATLEAVIKRGGGEGILSNALKKQLEDFFTLSGDMAVESYNGLLSAQKVRFKDRDMDVDFMFGSEAQLGRPVAEDVIIESDTMEALSNRYNELTDTNKKELMAYHTKVTKDGTPADMQRLREQVNKQFGFDALGYVVSTLGE